MKISIIVNDHDSEGRYLKAERVIEGNRISARVIEGWLKVSVLDSDDVFTTPVREYVVPVNRVLEYSLE